MGNYNPHAPIILGQEWVPIREEATVFSPGLNSYELGHGFTLDTSRTVTDARFYIDNPPAFFGQTFLAAIYPAGTEDDNGPIRSVVIPVNAGAITGAAITLGGGATSVADALASTSDGKYLLFLNGSSNFSVVSMFFATSQYTSLLQGKRILGLRLRYLASGSFVGASTTSSDVLVPTEVFNQVNITDDIGNGPAFDGLFTEPSTAIQGGVLQTRSFGEVNHSWSTNSPLLTADRMPWRHTELLRFEATSGSRLRVFIQFSPDPTTPAITSGRLSYVTLEVLYCEERRIAYGGRIFGSPLSNFTAQPYGLATNILPMRDIAFGTNPSLSAGSYTLTLSSMDPGALIGTAITLANLPNFVQDTKFPDVNALRELYSIPPHPGIQINKPFPLEFHLGDVFTKQTVRILPQLSLHDTTGAPLMEPHVYGRQAAAQVYQGQFADQEIADQAAGAATNYTQVRYIARRFGDTMVPLHLSRSTGGATIDLTPMEFDALPEIVDGWKEITLRFNSPHSMGTGTHPFWRWEAVGEKAGNRWEILGAIAPAISGVPGNFLQQVPATQRLGPATYGAPASGAQDNLSWYPGYSPLVSVNANDPSADAFLIFSQDMPTITGFGIQVLNQPVTGIGQNCGLNPCCIPSGIQYNRLTWPLPAGTGYARDSFSRTLSDSWGSADIGGAYTLVGTTTDFDVDGTRGLITPTTAASRRFATLSIGAIDFDITSEISVLNLPVSGADAEGYLVGRFTDTDNHYLGLVEVKDTGAINAWILKRVAAVLTTIVGPVPVGGLIGGTGASITARFVGMGSFLKLKMWRTGDPEPSPWTIETTDTSLTTGGSAGIMAISEPVSGSSFAFDNLLIGPPGYWFGYNELQRMDTVEPEWKTIMKATSPAVTGFNDYEARPGVLSSYRIRGVNVYNFPGLWSATVTGMIPAPGVTGGCLDNGHILIFTSNWQQDGSRNLAYSSVWEEGDVSEDFVFPEAGSVALQEMFGRDFVLAFHPTERSGERFTRTILVQAAAIPTETLADFVSLRDLAWAALPYVCVRDEDGNRWFATVLVPGGRVRRDRRLYTAPVDIIETTNTPAPVNPSPP